MSNQSISNLSLNYNFSRYVRGQKQGHYESFFLRANHPSLPLAFWIRYTVFSPHNHPDKALGELWAIYFDGTTVKHTTVKKEIPIEKCIFDNTIFNIKIEDAVLNHEKLCGCADSGKNRIEWDLKYRGNSKPLLVLPESFYMGKFPKAKLLVGLPLAVFNGKLNVNDTIIDIENWIGSQNHNWGIKHTDNYAWGQVAGFDNSPESFFEISTARLKYGPVWTPFMTLMVLRHDGREFRLNSLFRAILAKGKFNRFNWKFSSAGKGVSIEGEINAGKSNFVTLQYYNPPGGIKYCFNTKIASCKIKIRYKNKNGGFNETILETANRAAFEILTDDRDYGH
ncbi:MAG: hypothetical protein HYY40_02725 [Bacteroidetes bacterium]|nr:hypothetical protein [Bacteroidota bacterium]